MRSNHAARPTRANGLSKCKMQPMPALQRERRNNGPLRHRSATDHVRQRRSPGNWLPPGEWGGHEFGPDNTPPARSGSPRLPATPGPMLVRQVDLIGQGGVLTSLGEEVATLAKSVRASIEQNQRRDCPQHQFGTSLGMLNATVPVVRKCLCRTVSPQDLAHVVFPRLQARHKGDVRALARIIKARDQE